MTIAIKSGVKMPKQRAKPQSDWQRRMYPTKAEKEVFDAFVFEYLQTHTCRLRMGHFDPRTREMQFVGPMVNEVLTAKRCKDRIRQLKFRRGK